MATSRFNEQNFYEILEIEPGAPQHEIHAAYKRAKETYSPESPALYSMFTEEEARELLSLIEEAFRTLSNQTRRAKYDASLNSQTSTSSSFDEKEELPDFEGPLDRFGEGVAGPIQTIQTNSKSDALPEGFGRTRFSVYEIDPAFEEEILSRKEIDGPFLQKIRLYKQVNLVQVSEETRISKAYLGAVESNDFEALPAPVFVRGFIVQIARILGLDEKRVADSYIKKLREHKGGK